MAAAQHVQYNHSGTWVFALVEKQGEGGPGNYDLIFFGPDEPSTHVANVPEGTESGHWRDPK